jgi:hypothetical protein
MKLLLVGAASLTAITAAFANLGDTRADSAQRYGQPTFHRGANQEVYIEAIAGSMSGSIPWAT